MASPNKPTPPPRKFDQAFKAEALRMLDEGQSAVQVVKSLNVRDQLLHTAPAARMEVCPQETNPETTGHERTAGRE